MYKTGMVFIRFLLASLLFWAPGFVGAAAAPPPKVAEAPDPLKLKRDWWGYFDVPIEELAARSEKATRALKKLAAGHTETEHAELVQLVDLFSLNMRRLLEEKKNEGNFPDTKLQLLSEYSPAELLKVNRNYFKTDSDLKDLKKEIERGLSAKAQVQSKQDQLLIAYPSVPEATLEKLIAGLKIMVNQADMQAQTLHLSFLQKKQEFLEQERLRLKQELTIAEERLSVHDVSLATLSQKIKELEQKKVDATETLAKFQKQVTGKNVTQQESFSNQVKETSLLIAREQANVNLLLAQVEWQFVNIKQGSDRGDIFSAQDALAAAKRQLTVSQESALNLSISLEELQNKIRAEIVQKLDENMPEKEQVVRRLGSEIDLSVAKLYELKLSLLDAALYVDVLEGALLRQKKAPEMALLLLTSYLQKVVTFFQEFGNTTLFRMQNMPVTVWNLLKGVFILALAFALAKACSYLLRGRLKESGALAKTTEYILDRSLYYTILSLGLLFALATIGFDFTSLAIIAGALGVGIGFGLQSIVNNIFSGFVILTQRNIKIGDIVEVEPGVAGHVHEINLQNTTVRTFDGIYLTVPNSKITSQGIKNWTRREWIRRFRIPFAIALEEDKDRVRGLVIEAVKKLPCTVSGHAKFRDPQVWMVGFGESTLNLELVVWTDLSVSLKEGTASSSYFWEIERVLKENKIKTVTSWRGNLELKS